MNEAYPEKYLGSHRKNEKSIYKLTTLTKKQLN